MDQFKLVAPYAPNGDQPQAIKELVDGINNGVKEQTLLGATGTGKTFKTELSTSTATVSKTLTMS